MNVALWDWSDLCPRAAVTFLPRVLCLGFLVFKAMTASMAAPSASFSSRAWRCRRKRRRRSCRRTRAPSSLLLGHEENPLGCVFFPALLTVGILDIVSLILVPAAPVRCLGVVRGLRIHRAGFFNGYMRSWGLLRALVSGSLCSVSWCRPRSTGCSAFSAGAAFCGMHGSTVDTVHPPFEAFGSISHFSLDVCHARGVLKFWTFLVYDLKPYFHAPRASGSHLFDVCAACGVQEMCIIWEMASRSVSGHSALLGPTADTCTCVCLRGSSGGDSRLCVRDC